jgi:CheY-like chemotaxis protein
VPDGRVESIGAPRTVLLVDDDILVCTGTAAMLEDLGHTVLEAHTGPAALEILRTDHRVDLVITDYAMPGMTGTQLARNIRKMRPGLGVLLATGFAEGAEGETDDLALPRLAKPYRQSDLAAAIAEATAQGAERPAPLPLRAG